MNHLAVLDLIDWLVLAAAAPTMVAYLCRLDMLTYKGHQPAVVLMHACLACACAMAGHGAWQGNAGAMELFTVAGAALWIVVSYSSWRGHVPAHFDSAPVPLDDGPASHPAATG